MSLPRDIKDIVYEYSEPSSFRVRGPLIISSEREGKGVFEAKYAYKRLPDVPIWIQSRNINDRRLSISVNVKQGVWRVIQGPKKYIRARVYYCLILHHAEVTPVISSISIPRHRLAFTDIPLIALGLCSGAGAISLNLLSTDDEYDHVIYPDIYGDETMLVLLVAASSHAAINTMQAIASYYRPNGDNSAGFTFERNRDSGPLFISIPASELNKYVPYSSYVGDPTDKLEIWFFFGESPMITTERGKEDKLKRKGDRGSQLIGQARQALSKYYDATSPVGPELHDAQMQALYDNIVYELVALPKPSKNYYISITSPTHFSIVAKSELNAVMGVQGSGDAWSNSPY